MLWFAYFTLHLITHIICEHTSLEHSTAVNGNHRDGRIENLSIFLRNKYKELKNVEGKLEPMLKDPHSDMVEIDALRRVIAEITFGIKCIEAVIRNRQKYLIRKENIKVKADTKDDYKMVKTKIQKIRPVLHEKIRLLKWQERRGRQIETAVKKLKKNIRKGEKNLNRLNTSLRRHNAKYKNAKQPSVAHKTVTEDVKTTCVELEREIQDEELQLLKWRNATKVERKTLKELLQNLNQTAEEVKMLEMDMKQEKMKLKAFPYLTKTDDSDEKGTW